MLWTCAFDYQKAGNDLVSRIESSFWSPPQSQYVEEIAFPGQPGKQPAFTWDKAVYLSAAAAGSKLDAKRYQPLFDRIMKSLQSYGCTRHGVFGYSDLPVIGEKSDRYYDDNVWIVLAQIEMAESTHNTRYLKDAEKTFKFVMSGESSDLGGGIFWRENDRKSKNTCSNAPSALAAAKLYLLTKDNSYLETAERTYAWLKKLRDADGLMFDHIDLTGKIEQTKWTYNTALMIEAGLALHTATGERLYLDDAVQTATSARNHWIDPETGAIKDEAPFAHHLADAFFVLDKADPGKGWGAAARNAVDFAYQNGGKNGLFGSRWDRYDARSNKVNLLSQASMARGLLAAALASR